jgi:hypothetical protein
MKVGGGKRSTLLRLGLRLFDSPASSPVLFGQARGVLLTAIRNAPSLIAFFSSMVLRCLGAATIVASTIWPLIARNPEARRTSSNRWKTPLMDPAIFRPSRKIQIVLASGTGSVRPGNRRFQRLPEQLEIHERSQPSEAIALRRDLRQTRINVKESRRSVRLASVPPPHDEMNRSQARLIQRFSEASTLTAPPLTAKVHMVGVRLDFLGGQR